MSKALGFILKVTVPVACMVLLFSLVPDVVHAGDPAQQADPNLLTNRYLNPAIRFLAGIVGIVVTISIVIGGIEYASSGDDPQKVSKARNRIMNAIIALVAFLFLYAMFEWLIPGGFLNN